MLALRRFRLEARTLLLTVDRILMCNVSGEPLLWVVREMKSLAAKSYEVVVCVGRLYTSALVSCLPGR